MVIWTVVNPDKEPGRVTLITRYGADKVCLPLPFSSFRLPIINIPLDCLSSRYAYPSNSKYNPPSSVVMRSHAR
jgi:hypothetical protein